MTKTKAAIEELEALGAIENNTEDYNCQFIFTKKSECGAKILEILSQK